MSFEIPVRRRLEYKRLIATAVITEDGPYLQGQVPDDYAGSFEAEIEVVYAIIYIDYTGRLELETFNPPDLLNKDDETGLPITIANEHAIRLGTTTPDIVCTWRENTHLPAELKETASQMWLMFQRQIGEWVL